MELSFSSYLVTQILKSSYLHELQTISYHGIYSAN